MSVQRRPKTGTDKRGRVSWVVRWYEDGKQRSKSFATRGDAVQFDAEITQAKMRGQSAHLASDITVGELFDQWAGRETVIRDTTREGYRHTRDDLKPIEGKKATTLTAKDVEKWHQLLITGREWRDGSALSTRTAREHVSRLAAAYTWGARRDMVGRNVVQVADIPGLGTVARGGVCPWTYDQFIQVAVQLERGGHLYKTAPSAKNKQKADPHHAAGLLVRIALDTGARLSEILGLTWGDVDLEHGTITINKQVSKKGEYVDLKTPNANRVVPLPDALRDHMRHYKQAQKNTGDNAPVLATTRGGVCRPITMGAHIRHAADAVNLSGLHLHQARHLYASRLIEKGAPVTTVSALLGHASPSITLDIYSHVMQDYTESARAYIQ